MAFALAGMQGFRNRLVNSASLYQRDTSGIGCAASGSCNRILQPCRDDFGWLELQARGNHADYRNGEALAREVKAKCLDSQFLQTLYDQLKYDARFSCAKRQMVGVLRDRLQQSALIGIDRRRAADGCDPGR
jgi:hypothetical protein